MKKKLFLTIVGFMIIVNLQAAKFNGIIITSSDTIKMTISIPMNIHSGELDYTQLQKKIVYFNSQGKKVKLKPNEVKEVHITVNNETVIFLYRYGSPGFLFSSNKHLLLRLEQEFDNGRVKFFKYYYKVTKSNGTNMYGEPQSFGSVKSLVEIDLIQIEDGKLINSKDSRFKAIMMEYYGETRNHL